MGWGGIYPFSLFNIMSKLSQFAHEGKGRDDPRIFMAMEDTRRHFPYSLFFPGDNSTLRSGSLPLKWIRSIYIV